MCRRQRNPESQESSGRIVWNQRLEEWVSRDLLPGECPLTSLRSDPKGEGPGLGRKNQSWLGWTRQSPHPKGRQLLVQPHRGGQGALHQNKGQTSEEPRRSAQRVVERVIEEATWVCKVRGVYSLSIVCTFVSCPTLNSLFHHSLWECLQHCPVPAQGTQKLSWQQMLSNCLLHVTLHVSPSGNIQSNPYKKSINLAYYPHYRWKMEAQAGEVNLSKLTTNEWEN